MKSGDFIYIDYVGRVKDTGEIFDLTIESVAKKEKVYAPGVSYKPVSVVIDGNFVIKGLNDALKEMSVGDKRTVLIEPKDGFGERDVNYVRPVPLSSFKGQNIDPTPGSWVTINGVRGKIVSADGGRIKIDFNHPLAGKRIEYEVEVKREVTKDEEKVQAVVGYITALDADKVHVKMEGKEAEVKIDAKRDLPASLKKQIADMTIKHVKSVEKVKFVDEYGADGGKKEEPAKKAKE